MTFPDLAGINDCANELEQALAKMKPTPIDAHGLVRDLLSHLPCPDSLPAPEIVVEPDGDLGLDWDIRKDAVVSVSLSPTGNIRWAGLIGDWKAHERFVLPAWSPEFNEAMTRLGRVEPEAFPSKSVERRIRRQRPRRALG